MNPASFIVLWLALQGEGQQLDLSCPMWAMAEAHGNKWVCLKPTSAHYEPAEHVIEIRTKRTKRYLSTGPIDMSAVNCTADEHFLYWHNRSYCENNLPTKTLWIDNQRIGVIREVEEK